MFEPLVIESEPPPPSSVFSIFCLMILFCLFRPVGRGGGSRGLLEPPFWPPKDFIYTAIVHFKCPTGPLVSLLLRITAVQASLVAAYAGFSLEDQHRTRWRKLFARINTCGNKLLFQALESSPVVLLLLSPHLLFCQP